MTSKEETECFCNLDPHLLAPPTQDAEPRLGRSHQHRVQAFQDPGLLPGCAQTLSVILCCVLHESPPFPLKGWTIGDFRLYEARGRIKTCVVLTDRFKRPNLSPAYGQNNKTSNSFTSFSLWITVANL